jgi:hypothetical protein
MNAKIAPEHPGRGAVVYIRQSPVGLVIENTESRRRQYAPAESAGVMGSNEMSDRVFFGCLPLARPHAFSVRSRSR